MHSHFPKYTVVSSQLIVLWERYGECGEQYVYVVLLLGGFWTTHCGQHCNSALVECMGIAQFNEIQLTPLLLTSPATDGKYPEGTAGVGAPHRDSWCKPLVGWFGELDGSAHISIHLQPAV